MLTSNYCAPPDSYFPQPPRATLRDGEANGQSRHPESLGARCARADHKPLNNIDTHSSLVLLFVRASELGETHGVSAPGVTFAPQGAGTESRLRPAAELDSWNPPPRRSPSQRANQGPPLSSQNPGRLNRARTNSSGKGDGLTAAPAEQLPAGERNGVTLEDKPLSRSTSVKRAASAIRRAAAQTFAPLEKQEGEKRVLILMADGSEEMETIIAYDIFVRASLTPTLVSVSPQFSPSQSLPVSQDELTCDRGSACSRWM